MRQILDFLHDLQCNNNREWFAVNKSRYVDVQAVWNDFSLQLLSHIQQFDPSVAGLGLKDITYRIYRDTRFSTDKTPYKTHFGTFIAPGGKCSDYSGYYFHVGVGGANDYTAGHMLATGNYCYDKQIIQILREDISDDWDSFKRDVVNSAAPGFDLMLDGALKKVPKPYSPDAPYADWMRLKMFGMQIVVDDDFILDPNLAERVADLFRTTKPLNDFINRAVDYVKHPS